MHSLPIARSSKQRLPEKGMIRRAHGGEGEQLSAPKTEKAAAKDEDDSYTYTYETETEQGQEDDDNDEEEEVSLQSQILQECYTKRVFVFIHHFAGASDPLTPALRNEALAKGIHLKVLSVEKENGTGDFWADEPYNKHLHWAKRGYVDGYHAGYPCSTFSRLRPRRSEGMPGPVRSKKEPYGLKENSAAAQREADQGTIMACRARDMATAVVEAPRITTTRAIATS